MDQLDTYLKKATKSIFRYEALQDYSAEDGEESVREFMKSGVLPFLPEETEWWRMIKAKNDAGVNTCRVRMITDPLTDYTKMELALHRKSAAYSGEDIRIIGETQSDKIEKDLEDYYLVDGQYLFPMKYGPKGKYLGSVLVTGIEIAKYIEYSGQLIADSVPIAEYLSL